MTRALLSYSFLIFLQIPIIGGFFGGSFTGSLFFGMVDVSFLVLVMLQLLNSEFSVKVHIGAVMLLLLLSFACLTVIYSRTPDISYTLLLVSRDIIRIFTVTLMCSYVKNKKKFEHEFVQMLKFAIFCYITVAAFTMRYEYDYIGSSGRLMYGTYRDSNGVAHSICLIILVSFYFQSKGYNLWRYIFPMIALLFLVFSKTSILALIISIYFCYYFVGKNIKLILKYSIFWIITVSLLVAIRWDYLTSYLFEVQGGAALITLSGRTLIWQIAFENIPSSILFGYGINSFVSFSGILENNPGQIHNEIIQILFSYGVVGLIGYFAVIIYLLKKARNLERFPMISSVFLFYILAGVTEASLTTSIIPFWIILTLIGTSEFRKLE